LPAGEENVTVTTEPTGPAPALIERLGATVAPASEGIPTITPVATNTAPAAVVETRTHAVLPLLSFTSVPLVDDGAASGVDVADTTSLLVEQFP
jgi:hypothetical protein